MHALLAIKKELQEPITAEALGTYISLVDQAMAMGFEVQECLRHEGRQNSFEQIILNSLKQTFHLGLSLREALTHPQS